MFHLAKHDAVKPYSNFWAVCVLGGEVGVRIQFCVLFVISSQSHCFPACPAAEWPGLGGVRRQAVELDSTAG